MKINEITERDVDSNFETPKLARKASETAQRLRSLIDRVKSDQIDIDDATLTQISRLSGLLDKIGPGPLQFKSIKDVYDEMVHNTRIRNKGIDDETGVPWNKKAKDHEPEMTVDRFNMMMKLGL